MPRTGRPIKLQAYSALVHDINGVPATVTRECRSKDVFVSELRQAGYRVDYNKVKPKAVFDYIVNNTDASLIEWTCITKVNSDGTTNFEQNYKRMTERNKAMLDRLSIVSVVSIGGKK